MDIENIRPGMYVRVKGWLDGVACYVRKLEVTPEHTCDDCGGAGNFACYCDSGTDCSDCQNTGIGAECERCEGIGTIAESLTGRVIVTMVGDDGKHAVDPEDCERLPRTEFCGECGQIGCYHATPDSDD